MTTNNSSPFTSYQKFLIFSLAFLQFTVVLDFMIISPLGDEIMKQLSISTSQFGIIVSSYAFSAGLSGIMAAGFADKFDRKKLLLFFYTGFILGTFFCGLSQSYFTLLLSRIITGIFGGVIGSINVAIATDLFLPQQRGRVIGFIQMSFAGSQILGIPAGIYISNQFGWHYTFLMIVALAIGILLFIIKTMKPVDAHLAIQQDKNAFLHLYHTISNRKYQVGFTAITFLAMGGFMLMPFSVPFLVNNIHISKEEMPMIFMFTGISSMVMMPMIGRLSDRYDKFKLFMGGSILAIAMVLIYVHLPVVPLWQVVVINILMFIGIMSRFVPATALNTSIPELRDRGAYMSLTSSLQQMAGGLGAVLAGMIVKQENNTGPLLYFNVLGFVVSGFLLFTVVLMYRVDKELKRSAKSN